MFVFTQANEREDLEAILALQRDNLQEHLSEDEKQSHGFLTVSHNLDLLHKMNEVAPHIIAKNGEGLAGFCLSMTQAFEQDIPLLIPMFETMNELVYEGKKLKEYHYITVGQVCVADKYRGNGVFEGMYKAFQEQFVPSYQLAVTEISIRNTRSLAAHKRVGFVPLVQYTAPNGEVWQIVVWDWRKKYSPRFKPWAMGGVWF